MVPREYRLINEYKLLPIQPGKLHPDTGEIIWKRLIKGDGSFKPRSGGRYPNVSSIEPLRGTNDVLVVTERNVAYTYNPYGTLNRVTESGAVPWWTNGPDSALGIPRAGMGVNGYAGHGRGICGSDGTNGIVVAGILVSSNAIKTAFGVDYDGNNLWTSSAFTLASCVYATSNGFVNSGNVGGVGKFCLSSIATGSLINSVPIPYGGASILIGANFTTGKSVLAKDIGLGAPSAILSPTFSSLNTDDRITYDVGRLHRDGKYLTIFGSSVTVDTLCVTNSTPWATTWSNSDIFGTPPVSTYTITCDIDDTAGYFGCLMHPLDAHTQANVYARDIATGNILWTQFVNFSGKKYSSGSRNSSQCSSVGIAEDGYLYVGGLPT